MAIVVNDTTPRNQYTATYAQTTFTYSFEIFEVTDIKVFQGADGIHMDDCNVNIWENNTIMFQSHINGLTNQNNWNKTNYENFREILLYLKDNYTLNFKLLKE